MLRTTLAGMRHRKLRLLLSALAVVLGVTFVSGSMVLTDTIGRSFDDLFSNAYDHVDVHVSGQPNVAVPEAEGETAPAPIPADTVDAVAAVPGVAAATGIVEADGARVLDTNGDPIASVGSPRFGRNWTGEGGLIQLREGRGPTAPDEIAVDAAVAEASGHSIGDEVGVLTRKPRQNFTLVGIYGFSGGRDTIGGSQSVAFTDEVAQQLMLGETGVWSAIEVRAAGGTSPEQLRDDIATALGDDLRVRTGEEIADDEAGSMREALGFINNILLGFAAVALFVGVFLILNTFSIVVAQRARELALTRAIGAGRRQVFGSVMLEAAVVGTIAAVVGLATGVGVGTLLARVAGGFVDLAVAQPTVPASAVIAAFAVGLLVTLAAAALPAVRASRAPPVAAMQQAISGGDRRLTGPTIAGAAVLAAGAGTLAWGLIPDDAPGGLRLVLGGVLLSFIGVALLTPLVARPLVTAIGSLFSWSVPGKLGRLNSSRNPRRAAVTASALMVGVALVTGVNVVVQSAKTSFTETLDQRLNAELVIFGEQTGPHPPSFDPAALDAAADLPEVAAAAGVYRGRAEIDGANTFVSASTDPQALGRIYGASAVEGELDRLTPDRLAIDSDVAADRGLTVGDTVTAQLPRGDPHTLTVAAVYESGDLPGRYLLPPEVTADLNTPQPYLGLVQLTPGASADEVRPRLQTLLADSPEVSVTDRSGFVAQQASLLDTVLTLIQALLGLSILIAVLGIINTLALSVLERTRELGLLRAVGLGRAGTMRMVTVEAVVISFFGALLGVAVGTGLGAAAAGGLREEGITQLTLPWGDMGIYLLLAGVVGVVAAVLPAVRAARTDVLAAISYE